jgi:rare lipoprotein A
MSDGTRYEENGLTAAHISLPLGSLVRVSMIGSDRSVVVRITDRPGTRRRVIDLSRGAAAQLGMLSMGVAQVRLDPL